MFKNLLRHITKNLAPSPKNFKDLPLINGVYQEIINPDGLVYRFFTQEADSNQLTWHIDGEDREVTFLINEGWKFQMDNELPYTPKVGEKVSIPKEAFHRVIKGDGRLYVRIRKY